MAVMIGTFERGGTFHSQGLAIADLASRTGALNAFGDVCVVETPTASIGNAEKLDSGQVDFGFVASNLAGRASRGELPFRKTLALRTVAPANVGPVFFVAARRSGLRRIDDMRGKRIAVGPPANAMRDNVRAVLGALGWSDDDYQPLYLDFPDGAKALVEGRADCQVHPPVPNQVINDLAEAIELRVLEYGPGQLETVLRALPLFRRATLSVEAFKGLDVETEQLGVFNLIATHARVAEEKVYALAYLIAKNAEELGRLTPLFHSLPALLQPMRQGGAAALEIDGVPLHPGAVGAYRDAGLLPS